MCPNCGGDDTTGSLPLSSWQVASTTTSGPSSVRSGSDDGGQTTPGDSGDAGDRRIDIDHHEPSPSTGPRETATIMAAAFGLGDRTLDEDDVVEVTHPDYTAHTPPASDADPTPTEGRP